MQTARDKALVAIGVLVLQAPVACAPDVRAPGTAAAAGTPATGLAGASGTLVGGASALASGAGGLGGGGGSLGGSEASVTSGGGGQAGSSVAGQAGAANPPVGLPPDASCSLYVSHDGAGSACTPTAPCSLLGARDAVRRLNANMTADLQVCLAGGTYLLSEPFELLESATTHDSGTNGFNVVYRALNNEPPVLSGGRAISGFTLHDAANHVFQASAPGLTARQLFVNGQRATRARSRNNMGLTPIEHGFRSSTAELSKFKHQNHIELAGELDWRHYRCPVESITGTDVRLQDPCWALSQDVPGGGWWQFKEVGWVENAYELLDEPGEFYIDAEQGQIFYKPRDGEDMATAQVVAPILETLVRGQGVVGAPLHHVVFRGLTFSHATWNEPSTGLGYTSWQSGFLHRTPGSYSDYVFAVMPSNLTFEAVDSLRFENNRFEHLGASGLDLYRASSNNTLVGNRFDDISGRAITLGHIDDADAPEAEMLKHNTISNNFITHSGVEYRDCAIIFVGYTQDTLIEHNWLRYGPYTGISLGWGWASHPSSKASRNLIRWNRIEDFMQHTFDGSGVYALGIQRDSSVDHNYIHTGMPRGEGIFPDQGAAYMAWQWNVIEDVGWQWIHDWSAQAHHNNISHNITNQPNFEHSGGADKHDIFEDNRIVENGQWPQEALDIKAKAGLEPNYAHLAK